MFRGTLSGTMVVLHDHQVRRNALRLADDGLEGRVVPIGRDIHVDIVLADACRQSFQLFAPGSLHLAL
jgi:hypothetical protein